MGDLVGVASDLGVVTKSGSWFSFGEVRLGQGKERAAEFVGADVGLRDEIRRLVLEQLGAGTKPGGAKPAGANDLTDEVDIEDGAE